MIRGIGVDLCQKDRFLKNLDDKFFLSKIFHKKEIEALYEKESEEQKSAYLAARWAAKESLVKALGLGMFDLEINQMALSSQNTSPSWYFDPSTKTVLNEHCVSQVWTSLSYEANMVVAMTVLEGMSG